MKLLMFSTLFARGRRFSRAWPFLGFVFATSLQCDRSQEEPRPNPATRPSYSTTILKEIPTPPEVTALGAADRARLADLFEQIQKLEQEAKFEEAIPSAREILDTRTRLQGSAWWETRDASRRVKTLERIAALPAADQQRLAEIAVEQSRLENVKTQSDQAEAAETLRGQMSEYQQLLGDDHPYVARAATDLVALLIKTGETADAEGLVQSALTVNRKVLGENHPQVARNMGQLAYLHAQRGAYARSKRLCEEALALRRRAYGNDHAEVATGLQHLGMMHLFQGDFATAEPLLRKALELAQRHPSKDGPQIATLTGSLGHVLSKAGSYEEAESLIRRSLSMHEAIFGEDHPSVLHVRGGLGQFLNDKGDFAGAEPVLRQVVAKYRRLYGDEHASVAYAVNNLGVSLDGQGKYAEAESCHREAIAIQRSVSGNENTLGTFLNNLGVLLYRKGDYNEAEQLLREALEIQQRHRAAGTLWINSLNNLAAVLQVKGKIEEAERLYREALSQRRQQLGDAHHYTVNARNNLAHVLMERGDYAAAEAMLRANLDKQRALLGNEHLDVARTTFNLGRLLEKTGRERQAESLYKEALSAYRERVGREHPSLIQVLRVIGDLQCRREQYEVAEEHYREALNIAEHLRSQIVGAEIDRAMFADVVDLPDLANKLGHVLLKLHRFDEAFNTIERGRARSLLDLLARADRDLVAEVRRSGEREVAEKLENALAEETKARAAVRQVEAKLKAIQARTDVSRGEKTKRVSDGRHELDAARRRLRDHEAEVVMALRAVWPDAQPIPFVEIRAALEPDELLLSYVWDERGVALVVGSRRPPYVEGMFIAEGAENVTELEGLALRVRRRLAGRPQVEQPPRADWRDRFELFQALIPHEIRDKILSRNRIVVLADGPLRGIPFETLVVRMNDTAPADTENVRLLLDYRPRVVYADSATVYVNRRLERRGRPSSDSNAMSAFIVADPVFRRAQPTALAGASFASRGWREDDRGASVSQADLLRLYGGVLSPLPGTREEARLVAEAFVKSGGSADVLMREDATLPNIDATLADHRVVHFATHGLLGSESQPFDASLALTRPESPTLQDNGFLSLEYLIRRWRGRLAGCDLVVLSACDTQRGVSAGGNNMALPWGFMYAGVPSVVASLWKADDRATALLMARFYQNILGQYNDRRSGFAAGTPMPKDDALREAKAWLRDFSAADWQQSADRGGMGTAKFVPISSPDRRQFSDPHYWANFILVGSPG